MLMPIFKEGRIAWAAMFGHMTDVGGKVPGSLPTDARRSSRKACHPADQDLPQRRSCTDCSTCLLHNCRMPHWNRATSTPSSRRCARPRSACIEIAERFGDDVLYSAIDECSTATSAR
jgi:N-methylhydantoinase B